MFAPAMGIIEDEATGAAAVALTNADWAATCSISQGEGSELFTERGDDGRVRVGGRTIYDRTIAVEL